MYEDVNICVKRMGSLSDFFDCNVGLFQGEMISPILFPVFLNDIEMSLSNKMKACLLINYQFIYYYLLTMLSFFQTQLKGYKIC